MSKLLSENSPENCICDNACGKIHLLHHVKCKRCESRHFKLFCKECGGNGYFETCCCGARVVKIVCAIATAILGTDSYEELDILRKFRREYIESSLVGRVLSRYYDYVKYPAANMIAKRNLLKFAFSKILVLPGLNAVKRLGKDSGDRQAGVKAYGIFVLILIWCSLLFPFGLLTSALLATSKLKIESPAPKFKRGDK